VLEDLLSIFLYLLITTSLVQTLWWSSRKYKECSLWWYSVTTSWKYGRILYGGNSSWRLTLIMIHFRRKTKKK